MLPPTASPKRTALATASRFATGSTPGSAMSTAHACVFGAAPNAVAAPENIFDRVESWAWVSRPMTTSHFMSVDPLRRARVPVGRELVLVRDAQHPRLGEIVADDLQPHRQPLLAEAAGNRQPRQSREVGGNSVDVVQVHLHRVGRLLAQLERG